MERLALDFVILPPQHVMDIAISINNRACKSSHIVLDREKCFPHISLLMGCLGVAELKDVELILNRILAQQKALALNVTGIRTVRSSAGDIMTLDIETQDDLQLLHESLVEGLAAKLSRDAAQADVFDAPVTPSTLEWINGFIPNSCFENFWPHITIGYAKEDAVKEKFEPFTFTASKMAICHLGNHCTCRRILTEVGLAE